MLFLHSSKQALKTTGANFWRMSHNPNDDRLYEILDALGVMAWDETRDFSLAYLDEFAAMVKQHRNYPSVVVWSLCNEYECEQANISTGDVFRARKETLDAGRAIAANSKPDLHGQPTGLDVTGFSHAGVADFEAQHNATPDMPLVLSECCSCDEDNQRVCKLAL